MEISFHNLGSSSQACTLLAQYSTQYSWGVSADQGSLAVQLSPLQDSKLSLLCSPWLLSSILNSGDPPGSPLPSPRWPGNSLEAVGWGHHRAPLSCFTHFPWISVLHCLMSTVLKTAVLCIICFGVFRLTKFQVSHSSPCYFIVAGSGHPQHGSHSGMHARTECTALQRVCALVLPWRSSKFIFSLSYIHLLNLSFCLSSCAPYG